MLSMSVVVILLVVAAGLALAQPPVPDAQIGTLYPLIRAQADRATLPLSFLDQAHTEVEPWKQAGRAKLLELLHYDPPRCDPSPRLIERVDCGDYWRERIEFSTTPDIRVPAYVLIPKGGPERHPAVLLLHDHGAFFVWGKEKVIGLPDEHPALTAFKQTSYGGRSVGNELVKRGYVVMAIDMVYWGERRMLLPGDPPEWHDREQMSLEDVQNFNRRSSASTARFSVGLMESGITWSGVMFTDDLRSVDYLASRPDVDPERMGCCGLSVGGFRSAHLAGLHPRIRAAVVVGWMCSYPTMLQSHLSSIGEWALIPGLQQYMDLPDVASMNVPGGLMVINGTRDGLFPLEGVHTAFDKIARVYAKAGVPDHFEGVLYDGPHEFNVEMQERAFAWLDRWLMDGER